MVPTLDAFPSWDHLQSQIAARLQDHNALLWLCCILQAPEIMRSPKFDNNLLPCTCHSVHFGSDFDSQKSAQMTQIEGFKSYSSTPDLGLRMMLTAGAGLDGVKVDCQAILGMVGGGSPGQGGGPAMSAEYHAAMEQSVANNFPGNNCINCMCHSTEDLYRQDASFQTLCFLFGEGNLLHIIPLGNSGIASNCLTKNWVWETFV